MAAVFEQTAVAKDQWECKQCHRMIHAEETVAYHLIDRVLYGWCEPCFSRRNELPASD